MTDLFDLISKDLRTDHIKHLNSRAHSLTIHLPLPEISAYLTESQDPELLVYLSALLLVKLDRVAPTGPLAIPMLSMACTTMAVHRPDLIPNMAHYLSAIVATEMMKASDTDALVWAEVAYCTQQYEGASTAPTHSGNIRLARLLWPRASQLANAPRAEEVIEIIDLLAKARRFSFDLDPVSRVIAKSAIAFAIERNPRGRNEISGDTALDAEILQKVRDMNIQCEILRNDIEKLQRLLGAPDNIDKCEFTFLRDIFPKPAPPPRFLMDDIVFIDESAIVFTNKYFSARRTADFQVAVHQGYYQDSPVAVKMYESVSVDADFTLVEKEVKCYQYLSRMASDLNCFIRYHGSYIERNTLNIVMDYYQNDLMQAINEKMNSGEEFHEQTLTMMFKKLLVSFAEMESLGIIHGDIKPQNILIDQYWNLKIIDFSLSVLKNSELTCGITGDNLVQGTSGYMSPELMELEGNNKHQGNFSPEKADVFSLGMVFLQLLTLRSLEGLNAFRSNPQIMAILEKVRYEWAKKLLRPMLNADYRERPRFKDCLQFIDEVNCTLTYHQRR